MIRASRREWVPSALTGISPSLVTTRADKNINANVKTAPRRIFLMLTLSDESVPGAVATGFIDLTNLTPALIETRSLPLPVLTAQLTQLTTTVPVISSWPSPQKTSHEKVNLPVLSGEIRMRLTFLGDTLVRTPKARRLNPCSRSAEDISSTTGSPFFKVIESGLNSNFFALM